MRERAEPVGGVRRSRTRASGARRAAARIMRRKNTTLLRSCHSGWSKNVRSCIVTTHGHRRAQRHRVVRAVPHVGPQRASASAAAAGLLPREPGRAGGPAPRRARSAPGASVRPARGSSSLPGEQVEVDVGVRGESRRQRHRVHPGADRARGYRGDIEEHAHGAAVYESPQALRARSATRPFVRRRRAPAAECAHVSSAARARPRAASSRAQLVVVEEPFERVGARLDVAGAGTAAPRRRRPPRAPSLRRPRAARRAPAPRAPGARSLRNATRCSTPPARRSSASTTDHGCSPSTRTNGPVDALDTDPSRAARRRRARGSGRARAADALDRVDDRRQILARLDRADGQHVRRVDADASRPRRRCRRRCASSGGSTPSGAMCTSSGVKPSRISSIARERRRRDHEIGVLARDARARGGGS